MRLWPWPRSERRGYTELQSARVREEAEGRPSGTSAVEVVANMFADVLAAARVEGTDVLGPDLLHHVGGELVRRGEVVLVVDVEDGLGLVPTSDHQVLDGWRYRVEIPEPPGKVRKRTVPRDGVMHVMWRRHPREPWRGISPGSGAGTPAVQLAHRAEVKIMEEWRAPTAHIVPVPNPESAKGIREDLAAAKGGAVTPESTAAGWDQGPAGAPRQDFQAQRLGPTVPETMLRGHRDAVIAVAGEYGVPEALLAGDADGTAMREGYRRWILARVDPLARRIAAEASRVLETPVTISLRSLWGHDLQGRAAAVQKLVAAGVDVDSARQVAGLGEV